MTRTRQGYVMTRTRQGCVTKIGVRPPPFRLSIEVVETTPTQLHPYSDGTTQVSEGQPEYTWSFLSLDQRDRETISDMLKEASSEDNCLISFREVPPKRGEYQLIGVVATNRVSFSTDSSSTSDLEGVATGLLRIS